MRPLVTFKQSLFIVPAVTTAVLVLAGFGPSRAHAEAIDLTGSWNVEYLLSCDTLFTQSGSDVTGTFDCGQFDGTLEGTYDSASHELSLSGLVEDLLPVTVEGTVDGSGRSMDGTFTADPYVPEGEFEGERVGPGNASDLTGDWSLLISGVFSGDCVVDVQHSGTSVQASGDCGLVSTVEGTFISATGELTLEGIVLNDQELTMEATVTDEDSIEGTWVVDAPAPFAGEWRAERVSGPPHTPEREATATPHAAVTATPVSPGLPSTGGGPSDSSGQSSLLYLALILGGTAAVIVGARALYQRA